MGQAPDIVVNALKNAGSALTAAGQPSLTHEYLTKLRTMCWRQAMEHLPGALPDVHAREAEGLYRTGFDLVELEAWEPIQELVAEGYLARLGGGKYRRTEKPIPPVKDVRQRDPERLPDEDDAAYWKRFWRLNQESIEELEREQRRKEKRSSGARR